MQIFPYIGENQIAIPFSFRLTGIGLGLPFCGEARSFQEMLKFGI